MKLNRKKGIKNKIGARGERYAARYLRLHGYRILERDAELKNGEIDIIATRGKYIVFCEVKTRTAVPGESAYGRPANAVNREKRIRLVRAAREYLYAHQTNKQPRMDIIEVYLDPENQRRHKIIHLEAAFGDER